MNNKEQEKFWAQEYADEYARKNSEFNLEKMDSVWRTLLEKTPSVQNILEIGCNVGRNISSIERISPTIEKSAIEINSKALEFVLANNRIENSFCGSVLDSNFEDNSFDLVFTMGVLIHISPDSLLEVMNKMYRYSREYILIGEYFNRTPIMIEYQGQADKLFKRDFGKLFMTQFNVKLVNYGFLWGHIYDDAGFDDITWWLFQKQ